jgi:hypothetical protein
MNENTGNSMRAGHGSQLTPESHTLLRKKVAPKGRGCKGAAQRARCVS